MVRRFLAFFQGAVQLFAGLSALIGGAALTLAPDGSILGMPLELLRGTPFPDYLVPGLVLMLVVGGSNTLAGMWIFSGNPRAGRTGVAAGLILTGWIAVQIILIGYQHPIQLVYAVAGILGLILGLPAHPAGRRLTPRQA